MDERICVVTGGAGFIGCALSQKLVKRFSRVIVLDSLHPQVHAMPIRPAALHRCVEFHKADITATEVWDGLLATAHPSIVIHLAAETGTGQSLTEATRHSHVNAVGTGVMLDALARHKVIPDQIVLSSSRAIYGEGAWKRTDGEVFYPGPRTADQLARQMWGFEDAEHLPFRAGQTEPRPTSIYGATKLAQEHILEAWAVAFGAKFTILRLQNVYGPGQSLTNSYTGIVSHFAKLAREGKPIPLYEDGQMKRDFIFIDDVVDAMMRAIQVAPAGTTRLDIGTGVVSTIAQVAKIIAARYGSPPPQVNGAFRKGDVRHASCIIADTEKALSWSAQWSLESGIDALCEWIDKKFEN